MGFKPFDWVICASTFTKIDIYAYLLWKLVFEKMCKYTSKLLNPDCKECYEILFSVNDDMYRM